MILTFYRDVNRRWYVSLPDWPGSSAELEMVQGADILLGGLAGRDRLIDLDISLDPQWGREWIWARHKKDGNYVTHEGHTFWLCHVAMVVFGGGYPAHFWFRIA